MRFACANPLCENVLNHPHEAFCQTCWGHLPDKQKQHYEEQRHISLAAEKQAIAQLIAYLKAGGP